MSPARVFGGHQLRNLLRELPEGRVLAAGHTGVGALEERYQALVLLELVPLALDVGILVLGVEILLGVVGDGVDGLAQVVEIQGEHAVCALAKFEELDNKVLYGHDAREAR